MSTDVIIDGIRFYIGEFFEEPTADNDLCTVDKIEEILIRNLSYFDQIEDQYSNLQPTELKATLLKIQESALMRMAMRPNQWGIFSEPNAHQASELHVAAKRGHHKVIEILRNNKQILDTRNPLNYTALYLAAENGHKNIVDLLLEAGANPNQPCNYKTTALHIATCKGHSEIVESLLKAGADVDQCPVVLNNAIYFHNRKVVKMLLEANPDLDNCNEQRVTALTTAINRSDSEMLGLLIEAGVNVDTPYTLHHAVEIGNKAVVESLLKAGADTNAARVDTSASTPLRIAVENGHEDIAAMLMQYGAEI